MGIWRWRGDSEGVRNGFRGDFSSTYGHKLGIVGVGFGGDWGDWLLVVGLLC